ncbi:MAG: transglutaminase family protein [Streptosporangiales bacterium]|nr:transglutaminase family protein [Streptosporangiales bacterium]
MTTLETSATQTRTRYEIIDGFTIGPPAEDVHRLQVWCPVITDTPHQRVLDMADSSGICWQLTRETEFGNVMFHACAAPLPDPLPFEIRYLIERSSPGLTVDSGRVRQLATPQLFARALQPEKCVDVDATTRELARSVAGDETNPLEQARRFYDHVTGSMTYSAAEQSFKGSTQHALACSVGNCNDIHALFVSLCRSAGIPARFVLGQALDAPPETGEACDVCGYHCWAEFFIAGLGWLPADASCATKYGTHGLFGALETNHIAWSTGRDLLLAPPQHTERSSFFAAPYAEADGSAYPVARHLTYTQVNEQ